MDAFPLSWPVGYARTANPQRARFKTTFGAARDGLIAEIKRLGGKEIILSTNIPIKRDGLPYATFAKVKDPGVAVYFTYEGQQRVFACDKWQDVEDNVHAIRLTIDAIRGLDRWGVSEMLNRVFTGFKALPESVDAKTWFQILECDPRPTMFELKRAYLAKAKTSHPDRGGSAQAFQEINEAYNQGLQFVVDLKT